MNLDDLSMLYKTVPFALVDLGLGVFVLRRMPRVRFGQLKMALVAAGAIFWGIFATALRWSFWEWAIMIMPMRGCARSRVSS